MAIYIEESFAENILDLPAALKLAEEAFCLFGAGEAYNTPRVRTRIRKGALHILPASMPSKGVMGYKAYTSFRDGVKFKFYLHSAETGDLLAVIDADEIGRLRTGAASGVAAKYLAGKDASYMTVFGAGSQAKAQIDAVMAVRSVTHIDVVTRTAASAVKFAAEISARFGISAKYSDNAAESVKKSDIIATITSSPTPLIGKDWELKKGAHINAAGSNAFIRAELPEKIIENAVIVVDDKEVARLEAGDLLPSLEKGRLHWNAVIELGDIIANSRAARKNEADITIFESQGMGLLDLVCADYIYRKALEQGLGVPLPF